MKRSKRKNLNFVSKGKQKRRVLSRTFLDPVPRDRVNQMRIVSNQTYAVTCFSEMYAATVVKVLVGKISSRLWSPFPSLTTGIHKDRQINGVEGSH
jgi:hypothetical protein